MCYFPAPVDYWGRTPNLPNRKGGILDIWLWVGEIGLVFRPDAMYVSNARPVTAILEAADPNLSTRNTQRLGATLNGQSDQMLR